jgi:hypothetical protein
MHCPCTDDLRAPLRAAYSQLLLTCFPQLLEKQQQIEALQAEVERLGRGGVIREDNLAAQEAVIRVLKEQSDNEKAARTTAQKALSEKAEALDKCLAVQHDLAWEVEQCSSSGGRADRRADRGFR